MKNIFQNWKTTSAGIVLIVSAVVTYLYGMKHGGLTPETITAAVTQFLAGIGLIFAGDAGNNPPESLVGPRPKDRE